MLDSVGASTAAAFTIDDGASLIAADAYLILGDSTRALAAVRRMLDVLMTSSPADGGYPSHWIAGGWRALPEQSHDDEDQYDDEENVNGVAGVRDLRYSRVAKEPQ